MSNLRRSVWRGLSLSSVLLALAVAVPEVDSASVPSYNIQDLGTLDGGSYSVAYDVGSGGHVAGVALTQPDPNDPFMATYDHAFRWDGAMQDLKTLGGDTSAAYSVNGSGQVAGYSTIADGLRRAFFWQPSQMYDLGTLPNGDTSYGYALNDADAAGQVAVVGSSNFVYLDGQHAQSHAVLFRVSATGNVAGPYDLGTLPGYELRDGSKNVVIAADQNGYSTAYGVTNAGAAGQVQVVGESTVLISGNVKNHAFLFSVDAAGTVTSRTDLGTLSGHDRSVAYAVNNASPVQVAGSSSYGRTQRAFLWRNGTMQNLGTLSGGANSLARGLNNQGAVVGWSTIRDGSMRAFYWTASTGMVDLNSRIDRTLQKKWVLREATSISNTGQIAGWGLYNGARRAFLLTPR